MTQIDDESLERIRTGDTAAFTAMVREFEHAMLRTAYRILGQQADAEEVRQCILLKIWQEPHKLPAANRLAAWIHRCVINESIARLRHDKRQHRRNAMLAESLSDSVDEYAVDRDREFEEIRDAMAKLEPEQRAILSLKFDEQMTVREIGRVLEKPHTTVQSKLKKAIDDIRSLIHVALKDGERRK